MGAYLNGVEISPPLLNGQTYNAYLNGKLIWEEWGLVGNSSKFFGISPSGDLYLSSGSMTNGITKYNPLTDTIENTNVTSGMFDVPFRQSPDGTLYSAMRGTPGGIWKLTPSGTWQTTNFSSGYYLGLESTSAGYLFAGNSNTSSTSGIARLKTDGNWEICSSTNSERFLSLGLDSQTDTVYGFSSSPFTKIYYCTSANQATGTFQTISITGNGIIYGLGNTIDGKYWINNSGNLWYVTNNSTLNPVTSGVTTTLRSIVTIMPLMTSYGLSDDGYICEYDPYTSTFVNSIQAATTRVWDIYYIGDNNIYVSTQSGLRMWSVSSNTIYNVYRGGNAINTQTRYFCEIGGMLFCSGIGQTYRNLCRAYRP